ncbi:OmpA family protein [Rhodospirillum centenum]|uniref:Outer membrane protein OmpA (Probable proton motor MotY) n=1 Tax=Rhodospirillum centenum (strain ATCC 51521 / SW) TaxID=414684 RepID=B6IU88_RHOCS|nr:OmpA family protein [Rhodospirillum centenum]ACI99965.1 outer membrane protein OmpA (probable proton motor MotY) [Rhodospirillum centenum SW]
MTTRPDPRRLCRPLPAAAALLLLAACASAPENYPPLARVQQELADARTENVAAQAPVAFQEAERSVQRAQSRLGSAGEAEMEHLTYLAEVRLQTARAEAQAARFREERQSLVAQRESILRSAREDQLALARTVAEEDRQRIQQLESQLQQYQARETEAGTVLTLSNINFDLDSATLSPGDRQRLRPLVEYLRSQPDRAVLIEGHTDSQGPAAYNEELSQRRAEAVRDFLVDQGIQAARITTRGLGEGVPVASNETQAGRLQNRRIEVTVENPPRAASATGG